MKFRSEGVNPRKPLCPNKGVVARGSSFVRVHSSLAPVGAPGTPLGGGVVGETRVCRILRIPELCGFVFIYSK